MPRWPNPPGTRIPATPPSAPGAGRGPRDPPAGPPPAGEVRLRIGIAHPELANDEPAEAECLELEGHLVDRLGGRGRDDRLDVDVREERDLLADLLGDLAVRAE